MRSLAAAVALALVATSCAGSGGSPPGGANGAGPAATVVETHTLLEIEFEQEGRQAKQHVRITKQRKLFAVQLGLRIGNGIDQATAFELKRGRNRLAGELGNGHQEGAGPGHTDRTMQGNRLHAGAFGVLS